MYVFNLEKSEVNRPYTIQIPYMNYDIIDLQKLEDQREANQYFICTKSGLYIVKVIEGKAMMKFEIQNGEMPDENEP